LGKFALHLIPFRHFFLKGAVSVIGNGVVINPEVSFHGNGYASLQGAWISPARLSISDRAQAHHALPPAAR